MESLRVALTRPTSLYKGGNDEEFGPLFLFAIYRKKVPGKTRYLYCLWGTEKMFLCFLWIELNSRNF